MKNAVSRKRKKGTQLKVSHRKSLIKEVAVENVTRLEYDKSVLKRILKHLHCEKSKKRSVLVKENCPLEESTESRVDNQVKLKCRQLPNVVQELRKAIMRQNWDAATTLVMILCHPGLKYYSSIILKVCFILLCNHPNSNLDLMKNFIRVISNFVLEEDINKFLKILFVLRKNLLEPLESGKYIRKTGDYKVTRDPEFDGLQ